MPAAAIINDSTRCPAPGNSPLLHQEARAFELQDGRQLSYRTYGSEKKAANKNDRSSIKQPQRVIFYFHGFPGSSIDACEWDEAAKRQGIHIIAVDRPGIGSSSPDPGRTLYSFSQDILEMARGLDLPPQFRLLGVSGGAPYALTCARYLPPEVISSVGLLAGLGPLHQGISTQGLSFGTRISMSLLGWPTLSRWLLSGAATSIGSAEEAQLAERVKRELDCATAGRATASARHDDTENQRKAGLFARRFKEFYRQGVEGAVIDGKLVVQDWGFKLEDVPASLPTIRLWYSVSDTNIPVAMGRDIARRLANAALTELPNGNHYDLAIEYSESILRELVKDNTDKLRG